MVFLLSISLSYSQTPSWDWAKKISGNCTLNSTCTDSNGNLYVVGGYAGSNADFGGVVLTGSSTQRFYVAKYNASGILDWVKTALGTAGAEGFCVRVDLNGFVYVAGQFTGTNMNFGGTVISNHGAIDGFLAKYDVAGTFQWAKSFGGTVNETVFGMAIDPNESPILTGEFSSHLFILGDDTLTIDPSNIQCEIYIAKFDTSGSEIWAKCSRSNSGNNLGSRLSCDASSNIYLGACFVSDSLFFDTLGCALSSSGYYDLLVLKYNSSGVIQWMHTLNGSSDDYLMDLSTGSDGKVYFAGTHFGDSLEFENTILLPSDGAGFLACYDSSGHENWVRAIPELPNGLAVDPASNVYLTGSFNGASMIIGNDTLQNTTTNGNADAFCIGYDSNGGVQWAKQMGGVNYDYGDYVSVDGFGNLYYSGMFTSQTMHFDTLSLTLAGTGYNVFMAKINLDPTGIDATNSVYTNELFPNPCNSILNFRSGCVKLGEQYRILDVSGRCVVSGKFTTLPTAINTEGLTPGMYFILTGEKKIQCSRFIKN